MNINASDDFFYRYKMPILQIDKIGKGNGKFTKLNNIQEICKSINTPLKILMFYLSQCLGTNYKDINLNGHYSKDDLINIICKFNKDFVICEKCNIPEIEPYLEGKKKNIKLFFKCSACGDQYEKIGSSKLNDKTIDTIINYYKINKYVKTNGNV